ncbi:alkanesulfonate transporter substrate-binding subunit [Bacteroidales bacterium Barb6]|nr:alkanesulfonate transporter substrate-binding subunit [Bacteroidales bacterium Barb6]OAV68399.1 alkanesulfonate transporter substrate-binding subunit [Bacteroidales bacterium Barb6XT]
MNYMKGINAAAVLAAVVLSGCSGQGSKIQGASEEFPLGQVEIQGLSASACAAPSYIAVEKGFFAAEGIDVTLVSGTFETSKAGLASGKYPVTNGDFQFFPSVSEGLDIKLIDGMHQGCIKLLTPPGSDITTAAGLAGKRIGVDEIGGSPMAVTTIVLGNAGIDPMTGVTWLPYPLDQLKAVAEKGEVDAVALWDPFATIAEQQGYHVITDIGTDPLFAGKYCCFLFASGKQIRENPERIKALLRAYHKASEWIAANPEETAQICIDKGYIASDDPEFVAGLLKSYKYHATHEPGLKHQVVRDALFFVSELKKTGFIPAATDAQKFVDDLYYDIAADVPAGHQASPSH